MRKNSSIYAAAVGLIFLVLSHSQAQFDQHGRWDYHKGFEPAHLTYVSYNREQADEMINYWNLLDERGSETEWAGDYLLYSEELSSSFLRFFPGAGYVRLTVRTCMPDVGRFDYGSVDERWDRIHLHPANSLGAPTTLIKITWGKRRYLVEQARIENFARFASGRRILKKGEWPDDSYFINELDIEKTTDGLPSLPDEFSHYVEPPTRANLKQVTYKPTSDSEIKVIVTLDRGKNDGIQKGMTFYRESGDSLISLQVDRVGDRWCQATALHYGSDDSLALRKISIYAKGSEWTTCIQCVYQTQ